MKIKRKVQKNLPQLIEYAWDNGIKNKGFESERTSRAYFDYDGYLSCTRAMEPSDSFTVEVEEEITEDTELDLVLRFISEDKAYYTNPQTMSINTCLGSAPDDIITTHFYIENDNRELVLIWRDGKLVE